jgi:hypothetical protein
LKLRVPVLTLVSLLTNSSRFELGSGCSKVVSGCVKSTKVQVPPATNFVGASKNLRTKRNPAKIYKNARNRLHEKRAISL